MLGLDVGPSEDGAFWHAFLRSLLARGLTGVKLVTSDAHEGLKAAIASVLQGVSWQRCRTHLMRNALALVPKGAQQMVAATIRTVFYQPDTESARSTWRRVADGFQPRWPRLAKLLDEAEDEVLAYLAFPHEHWRQIWSTNSTPSTAATLEGSTTASVRIQATVPPFAAYGRHNPAGSSNSRSCSLV